MNPKAVGANVTFFQLFPASLIHRVLEPFVIRGRTILKGIWQTNRQQCNSYIEGGLNGQFSDWIAEFYAAEAFDVQRWCQTSNKSVQNELHVFEDASEDAYCAVAYVVTEKKSI